MPSSPRLRFASPWIAALAGLVGGAAAGATPPATASEPAPAAPVAAEAHEPLYAAPTRVDRIGRIVAPVYVNGRGPFRMIVDTGANRSTLAPHVVAQLGLVVDESRQVRLHGVTGSQLVPTVYVERLEMGAFRIERTNLPVVEPKILAGTDGILGLAGLSRERLSVDFVNDRVTLTRGTPRRPDVGFRGPEDSEWLRVPARLTRDGLLVVDARVGRVAVKAVIDTGAERTLGNNALREALARAAREDAAQTTTEVYGATLDSQTGAVMSVPPLQFGEAQIARLPLVFGDFGVFTVWGLDRRPALLLGMDVLGVLQELVIDWRARELQIRS